MRLWRGLLIGLVGFGFASFGGSLQAQDLGSGGLKENLDLPLDAIGEAGEEEDAPEVVNFYGQTLEGDGFFYAVDRSGSMQDSGELRASEAGDQPQYLGVLRPDRVRRRLPRRRDPEVPLERPPRRSEPGHEERRALVDLGHGRRQR